MTERAPAPARLFEDTIDWDAYWREPREDDTYPAIVSGRPKFELLERFFEQGGVPGDAAFVGCGTGDLPAMVAAAHPETAVVGYDAASSVVLANREEYGKYAVLPNLSFRTAVLPDFRVDRQFDLVYTYATLHYVRDIEAAIAALYRHVRPGGHLVCHYPNDAFRDAHQDVAGALRERFQLVLEGANVLSRERIADLLATDVRDFWDATDADAPFVRPDNPCVVVET